MTLIKGIKNLIDRQRELGAQEDEQNRKEASLIFKESKPATQKQIKPKKN